MYKVFLVDDEEITLAQTAESIPWLENGFTVIGTESDPCRAVERIVSERPEVVFLDLKMPGIDGHEVMRRVLEQDLHPEFIMLSAYGDFSDARTFFRREGFDYLLKPISSNDMDLLLDNLSRRLSLKYPPDEKSDDKTDDIESTTNESFAALISHIRENFSENHTLDKLSKRFCLSSSYICALFSKYYNTSLSSFVTGLRMEEAAKRIRRGGESFKSIAISCGYRDYYYFSKMFKAYYGLSPSQYMSLEETEGSGEEEA